MIRPLVTVLSLTIAGCGGSDEFVPPVEDVPDAAAEPDAAGPALRATGTATAPGTGAERVDCDFFLDVFDVTDDGSGGWTAFGAGEVIRRSFDGDQLLFEFSALVAGPISLTDTGGGVEVRLVGDQTGGMPFWTELEVITGASTGAMTWEGTWTCAPILPGDPDTMDLELDAPGTWTIGPL
jgi:hypothetical protein